MSKGCQKTLSESIQMSDVDLTRDHAGLTDNFAARRYFSKFDAITGHLARVAGAMHEDGELSKLEVRVLSGYAQSLARTFEALSHKYLMTGRNTGTFFGSLTIDRSESGFPVYQEILTMANDAQQAARHLANTPTVPEFKEQMIRTIVGDLEIPTKLQFALSQRLYYETIANGEHFWARNDPEAVWERNLQGERRTYLIHWAVYDSQINLPVVYLMQVEDSGRVSLPKDQYRWPAAQSHLIAQSLAGLKLLTIAKGFDEDFNDLHPKRLQRIHIGPMYSSSFTRQTGPLREVLEEARSPEGQDWALAWTAEELVSERVVEERSGWFGSVEREVFALDPFSGRGADTGATRTERSIILPQRPYQVLAEKNPPGFRTVRKFVVSPGGRVYSYR